MFKDRTEAGLQLAKRLAHYKDNKDATVLALPRGGIVPGFEISEKLHVPLDVLIVRKIGFPGQPEFAIGAIAETGSIFLNRNIISAYVPESYLNKEIERQKDEIARRVALYRGGKSLGGLEGRTIILVDDGVATGSTMKAGIMALKEQRIKKLVIALPVAPYDTAQELKGMCGELICLDTPEYMGSVGSFYMDFCQVSDEEVTEFLRKTTLESVKT
ncbi:MAG: phosphoribosyltransferase [Nitrospiraceae bacterium]|nr:phosphoribosyltransferase [Nitrospiraceae bacterium]